LVAEDNSANQELIKYHLDNFGLNYTIVDNGKDAVDKYKENLYDLILMDINMPILDGIGAFKEIREYENKNNLKNIPVSALTANAIKGDREKFLELGMNNYLSKPIEIIELKEFFLKYLKIDNNSVDNYNLQNSNTPKENDKLNLEKISASSVAKHLGLPETIGEKILNKFKNDIFKDLNELKSFIDIEDSEQIRQKSHYLKSSCLNVDLSPAVEILQSLESNNNDKKENLVSQFNNLYNTVKSALKD
jgi:CheY-like chemotaxis protein